MEQQVEDKEFGNNWVGDINNAFWETLLDLTSDQVLMIDKKGKILYTNKDIFGTCRAEAIGKDFFSIAPSTYVFILKDKLKETEELNTTTSFETLFKIEGKVKFFEINIKPLFDNKSQIMGYALASVDITEVKAAKKIYEYKVNLEKLFLNISSKFINLPAEAIDKGINEAIELIARFTNSEHAYIMLRDTPNSTIDFEWKSTTRVNSENHCDNNRIRHFMSSSVYKHDFTSPQLIVLDDEYDLVKNCPVFICPMILENKQYGALVLIGKSNASKEWSEDFSKPMMLIANVFINTLERKKNTLYEKDREEELKKTIRIRTEKIEHQKETLIKQANELKEAEAKVRAAYQELKEANILLEQKVTDRTSSLEKTNQELDRFVYSVSHDIKAPLASVLGLVNLIRLSPENEMDEHLKLMEKSINKLNGFVNDILEYSRNSRLTIKHDVIDFYQQIEFACDDLRHMDKADNVELITSYHITTPVVSDENRLQSILKNLISNAVKYHNPENDNSWVKIEVNVKDDIHIKISDNGIGINDESLPHIFDMFYRASEKSSGSGLGLYIVKETIEKMGGSIKVTSKENLGTTFEFTLPNLTN